MRPKERTKAPQNDLFRLKLVNLIDLRHELCRLGENPYWQYFCGEEYFQHRLLIDPSQMTRFRTRLGPSGCEKLLELTIAAGLATRAVKPSSFTQVTVDTTVQEKAIAFPTDGRCVSQRPRVVGAVGETLRHRTQAELCSQRQAIAVPAAALRGGN